MAGKAKGGPPPKTPSMTMFGDWMVEKASPTCVPRLCTLQISRLVMQRSREPDLHTVYIAVKMDGSRHSLRTSEIVLASGVASQTVELEMELEVCFSLQYSHSLKRDNQLQVLLQRKKRLRYKNSRLPGYKTVACASINMTSVLQRALELRELDLFAVSAAPSVAKNGHGQLEQMRVSMAHVTVTCSSQPLLDRFSAGFASGERESRRAAKDVAKEAARRSADEASDAELSADADGAQLSGDADVDAASDRDRLDEMEHESADEMQMDELAQAKTLKYIMELPATDSAHEHRRRQNLKQRLRSQLQKMMRGMMRPGDDEDDTRLSRSSGKKQKKSGGTKQHIVDDDLLEAALAAAQTQDQEEQNRLFDELSELNLSAADSEVSDDAESVRSTAKPTLRPFFTSKAISEDTLNRDSSQSLSQLRASYVSGSGVAVAVAVATPISANSQSQSQSQPKRTSAPFTPNAPYTVALEQRECYTPPVTAPTAPAFGLEHVKRALGEQLNRLFDDEVKEPQCMSLQHAPGAAQPSHACGGLPDPLAFVSAASVGSTAAHHIADRLSVHGVRAVVTPTHAETRSAFSFLATRIAKYCDVHSHAPPLIRVVLVGGDAHVNGALRSFVEHFAAKPPTWLRYVLFFIVPLVGSHGHAQTNVARYLSTVDRTYATMFAEPLWRAEEPPTTCASAPTSGFDTQLAAADCAARRIREYLNSANAVLNLAIGEVQITTASTGKQQRTEDDSVFVPFLSDVRVGIDSSHTAGESADEQLPTLQPSSGSQSAAVQPPSIGASLNTSQPIGIQVDRTSGVLSGGLSQSPPGVTTPIATGAVTPPSSPAAISGSLPRPAAMFTPQLQGLDAPGTECIELQVDMWLLPGRVRPEDKEKEKEGDRDWKEERSTSKDDRESSKKEERERKEKDRRKADAAKQTCLKSHFRTVCVSRVPSLAQMHAVCASLSGLASSSANAAQLVHSVAPGLLSLVGLLGSPSAVSGTNGSLPAPPTQQMSNVAQQQISELLTTLTLAYTTIREKKQKMTMRIGKKPNKDKDKDDVARSQLLDGVTRLVCSAPARGDKTTPLTIFVDGVEYASVKFFQLSSHWQSHVKHFPIACFLAPSSQPFAANVSQLPLAGSL